MQRLLLTSSLSFVGWDLPRWLPGDPGDLKLVYISTAAKVEDEGASWFVNDRKTLAEMGFANYDEYDLTGKSREDVEEKLAGADVVFVCGGNTFYLLEQIRRSGFSTVVKKRLKQGLVYIGTSGGTIVAGKDITPNKWPEKMQLAPRLRSYKGMGLVDLSIWTHWGSEYFKSLYMDYRTKIGYDKKYKLVTLNDFQYLRVEGEMYKIEEADRVEARKRKEAREGKKAAD